VRTDDGPESAPTEGAGVAPLLAAEDPARRLQARYLASSAVIACLLILNQLLVQPQILALAIDPPTINRAGRQRMLCQRLAKAALAAVRAGDPPGRRRYLEELEEARAAWASAHEALRREPGGGAAIRDGLREVGPPFERLQGAASRLVRALATPGGDAGAERAAVGAILADEGDYLRRMDRLVGLYEAGARARVDRLLRTGWLLTGLTLLAIAGVGRFVLRPAAAIIRRQLGALLRARHALEAEVRERTRELEEANRHLADEAARRSLAEARHRAASEMAGHASRINTLGQMAAGLAHELNQPLGAVANYAEGCLAALEGAAPDLAAVRDALRKLLASTLRAGEVIRRVRRFVTRRELEPGPFDPAGALAEVAELMADDARRRRITLDVDAVSDLPKVWGDPVQVQQVLINLVRNAFEAIDASETSARTVVISARRADPGRVAVSVRDDGEGIAADRLGRIFDAYFSTRAEGMGMGLAICRAIVEAHQGTLTVESEPGAGSTFGFTLPAVEAGDDDRRHGVRR
jgi:signal transduction histidine kinase